MIEAFLAVYFASITYHSAIAALESKGSKFFTYGMTIVFAYTCYYFVCQVLK